MWRRFAFTTPASRKLGARTRARPCLCTGRTSCQRGCSRASCTSSRPLSVHGADGVPAAQRQSFASPSRSCTPRTLPSSSCGSTASKSSSKWRRTWPIPSCRRTANKLLRRPCIGGRRGLLGGTCPIGAAAVLGLSVVVAIGPAKGINCLRYFLGAAPEYGTNEVLFLDIKDGAHLPVGARRTVGRPEPNREPHEQLPGLLSPCYRRRAGTSARTLCPRCRLCPLCLSLRHLCGCLSAADDDNAHAALPNHTVPDAGHS